MGKHIRHFAQTILMLVLLCYPMFVMAEPTIEETVSFINEKFKREGNYGTRSKQLSVEDCVATLSDSSSTSSESDFSLSDVNLSSLDNIEIENLILPMDRNVLPPSYLYHVKLGIKIGGSNSTRYKSFAFNSAEEAKRVARAFHYLSSRCGAKGELF